MTSRNGANRFSQDQAIGRFRSFLNNHQSGTDQYQREITEFKVTDTSYGIKWISAQQEITSLPKGNLLRALDHNYWHIEVGKRGALTAHAYPKSLEQFKGKKFFGINIK